MKLNKIILSAALLFTIVFTACEDDNNYDIGKTVINEPTWEKNIFPGADWATADPTKYGYSADLGEKIDTLVVRNGDVSGLCLVIGGEMVHQYGKNELSYLASTRKSILSMLYGIYVDNGTIDLDRTVGELIEEGVIKDDVGGLLDIEKRATIRHCISARSGCYHPASNSGDDLDKAPLRGSQEPGTYHLYSNWDFNVSGAIFEGLTGKNIYDALGEHFAVPLQFNDWVRSKQVKGGTLSTSVYPAYHFYLSARDMARLGYLMLRKGNWNGTQIISEEWIEESTSAITPVSEMNPVTERTESHGYGYMWWVWDGNANRDGYKDAYMAIGAGGQYIVVLPALDMVLTIKRDTDILSTDTFSNGLVIHLLNMIIGEQIPAE